MIRKPTILKIIDATAGALLCRLYGSLNYLDGRDLPPDHIPPENLRRILVIRPGGMGDMIVLMPMLEALRARFPAAAIDLVCERRNMEVVRLAGWQGKVICYDQHPVTFKAAIRRARYDVVIDTEQFHNFSAIFAHWAGAPIRIGFKVNPHRNALYTHLINYELDGPESRQFARLVEPLDIRDGFPAVEGQFAALALPLPATLEHALKSHAGPRGFAAMSVGSTSPSKRWPAERYAEVAGALNRDCGLTPVLVGGRAERRDRATVLQALRAAGIPVLSIAGDHSLAETAALLQRAALFIGGDSGLAHLAVALGVPSVAIFGPSDPRKWGTDNARHAVAVMPTPCAPCAIFGYHRPCRHVACMTRITTADVLAACRRVLR